MSLIYNLPNLEHKRGSAPFQINSHQLNARNLSHQPSKVQQQYTPLQQSNPKHQALKMNKSFVDQDLSLRQAEHALQRMGQLDQNFLQAYQQLEWQSQMQQQQQAYQQYFDYSQIQQQQQQSQQRKQKEDAEVKIKMQAEKELAKIRQLTKYLKETKTYQNMKLMRLQKEQQQLRDFREKVETKAYQCDQSLMKIEAEKENLKNLHKLIDIEESKVRFSKSLNRRQDPYQDSPSSGYDRQPYHHDNQSLNMSSIKTNSSTINNRQNKSSCHDCGIILDNTQQHEAGEEPPVFQLNSILDWLDYRRHQTSEHGKHIQRKQLRNLQKLEELRKEQEGKKRDWASLRVSKLQSLIKFAS